MDTIKKYWKYVATALVVMVLCTSGGYCAGRRAVPSKVTVNTEKTETKDNTAKVQTDTKIAVTGKLDTQTDTKKEQHIKRTKTTVTRKDGTTVSKETEEITSGSEKNAGTKSSVGVEVQQEVKSEKHEQDKVVQRSETKTEYYNPKWNITAVVIVTPDDLFTPQGLTPKFGGILQHSLLDLGSLHLNVSVLTIIDLTAFKNTQVGAGIGFAF